MTSIATQKALGVAIAVCGVAGTALSLQDHDPVPIEKKRIRASDIYALRSRMTLKREAGATGTTPSWYLNDKPSRLRVSDVFSLGRKEGKIETQG